MGKGWVVVGAGLLVGAVLIGFPIGLVGYAWRDRVSRMRRARYSTAQRLLKQQQKIR